MDLIHDHLHHWDEALPRVPLKVDRLTLAKRRWRAAAADGSDFGFDLEHPLEDGDIFHQSGSAVYAIEQQPEPVLEVSLGNSPEGAARLGWLFGNLHFPIQITTEAVRVIDDPAVRQVCEREHLHFHSTQQVFAPLGAGHAHGHEHHHH